MKYFSAIENRYNKQADAIEISHRPEEKLLELRYSIKAR